MKTLTPKPGDIERTWYVIDATDQPLGRLSSKIASILCGKHKPYYARNIDTGDYVIVINAEKVKVTGLKSIQKVYHSFSGYPSGLKDIPYSRMLEKNPTKIIEHSVRGMMPKTVLGDAMFKKLKVYAGNEHPHSAQKPVELKL
ncbi:MAG TPA: 50S ribosomal protein L13 [Candidatus Syntrophosphaera sp.]|jgi:large subunit ribosomal protein L13|nr:50S ribosomal protein L13 [Candidatus Syntrophosphaera thermopropionivorans]HRR98509.1 50S ribosomal protein L13 [Candidatus Syntrophosphaera sp.]HOL34074.1 50S ribosomal protein L13 [Candidatus Syntrophosphaera thermopropionivorans]HPQ31313.1 50S ribosomal protein L13 [Candidatus Syntrophosphaera thermopropionivorans]HQK58173.1 50S ribosomal protein L13 [Candidatus Syntrophosphaera thermopropionivorans]